MLLLQVSEQVSSIVSEAVRQSRHSAPGDWEKSWSG